ncbi:MAG: DNA-binding protein, partial [Archaeoglobales archaeon]
MIYVMNSPILTAPGKYAYELIDIERARRLLKEPFESAIGHEAAARFLSKLIGVEVPTQRISIAMRPGDVAVIFRVKQR